MPHRRAACSAYSSIRIHIFICMYSSMSNVPNAMCAIPVEIYIGTSKINTNHSDGFLGAHVRDVTLAIQFSLPTIPLTGVPHYAGVYDLMGVSVSECVFNICTRSVPIATTLI